MADSKFGLPNLKIGTQTWNSKFGLPSLKIGQISSLGTTYTLSLVHLVLARKPDIFFNKLEVSILDSSLSSFVIVMYFSSGSVPQYGIDYILLN